MIDKYHKNANENKNIESTTIKYLQKCTTLRDWALIKVEYVNQMQKKF